MAQIEYSKEQEIDEYLTLLIENGHLENPVLGITRQVINRGRESLSEKQEYVFKTQVWDRFVLEQCDDCGNEIPWSEMYFAIDNGRCSYCDHKYGKIMAE